MYFLTSVLELFGQLAVCKGKDFAREKVRHRNEYRLSSLGNTRKKTLKVFFASQPNFCINRRPIFGGKQLACLHPSVFLCPGLELHLRISG